MWLAPILGYVGFGKRVQIVGTVTSFIYVWLGSAMCLGSEIPCPPAPTSPLFSRFDWSEDHFYFVFEGEPYATYRFQVSTNLQDWTTISTSRTSPASETFGFFAAPGPHGFFRAVLDDPIYPLFNFAVRASDSIFPDRGGMVVDSYDSSDPDYSTDGGYDPSKAKDGGDLAVGGSPSGNELNLWNSRIMGRLYTAPEINVSLGSNGVLGSKEWHIGGDTGIQPGWLSNNLRATFMAKPASAPYTNGIAPSAGVFEGVAYTYVLGDGDYHLPGLKLTNGERCIVLADARLLVTSNISVSGTAQILIASNATLQLYCAGDDARFGAGGVSNAGDIKNFQYYGLRSNWGLEFAQSSLKGLIHAPNSYCRLRGDTPSGRIELTGACIVRDLEAHRLVLHYDEGLKKLCPGQQ